MFKEWKKLAGKPLRIIDILISIVVIGLTVFLIIYWKHIPEQVPQHWNFAGEIDDYADAGSYIMLVIMMYFFYAWHQLTKLSPTFGWKENIFGKEPAAKVSEEVEKEAFNTLMLMLWICDLILQIVLAYIVVCGVFVANLGKWFLSVTFILLTADFVLFGIKLVRIKNRVR